MLRVSHNSLRTIQLKLEVTKLVPFGRAPIEMRSLRKASQLTPISEMFWRANRRYVRSRFGVDDFDI
jgi:hypothetical protein